MSVKLKICTFNLRVPSEKDGINHFENRKDLILACIEREKPDIIGFQEATDSSRAWLLDVLNDYAMLGCGRKKDLTGEGTLVAYKKHDFQALSMENFWLSLAPSVPGSTFGADQSKCPRITTAVVLKHKDAEKPFLFINTHLDHKGSAARLHGSIELLQFISEKSEGVILTGDMNAHPDAPEIKVITDCEFRKLADITCHIDGTFHGFGTREKMSKIDYIFTDMKADPKKSYAVEDIPVDGLYISDHRPVIGFVTVE
jgi:endonuclease/exonuclease/phosphatase family metal-dependent hydrolase